MKNKKNKAYTTTIIVLCIILALAVGLLLVLLAGSNSTKPEETAAALPQETSPSEHMSTEPLPTESVATEPIPAETQAPSIPDMTVSTPYCNLYYPADLKDSVRAAVEKTAGGCIVKFYGTAETVEEHIFSVFFAEASENSFPVGMFTDENTSMDINLELCDLPDVEELYVLQEGVNYLLDRLKENPAFSSELNQNIPEAEESGEIREEQEPADLVVKTPYCELYYPAQWKDAITVTEQTLEFGYTVTFHCLINDKKAELFTVLFAEVSDESFPIGVITADGITMDVSLELPAITESEAWSEAELELFSKLQEKVNYLMDRLKQLDAFEGINQ